MLRFLADEDFDNDIVRGMLRRLPTMDIVRVQDVGLSGALDPKSAHMRMVHSASRGEGIFHDHTFHCCGDRGVVIEVRQFVSPGAIHVEMLHHIGHQIP
jgi:hypothetical protein